MFPMWSILSLILILIPIEGTAASPVRAKSGLLRQDLAEEWSAGARFPEPGVVRDLIDMVPAFIHVTVIEPTEANYFRHCVCPSPQSPGKVLHNVGTQQRARAGGSVPAARARRCPLRHRSHRASPTEHEKT